MAWGDVERDELDLEMGRYASPDHCCLRDQEDDIALVLQVKSIDQSRNVLTACRGTGGGIDDPVEIRLAPSELMGLLL